MREIWGSELMLLDVELLRRQERNRAYMMSLQSRNLLMNFSLEAGRGEIFQDRDNVAHGGWESPTCQLRGHFLGHWLSAAALAYHATGDMELKAKADAIVAELKLCQEDNGGEWVAPIPEKYLDWIARGKPVWAPQYTIHKVFMGLLDMAQYAGNPQALDVAVHFAKWFDRWSAGFTREQFDDILDVETGGMLEVWVQLYELTGDAMYLRLMDRYYRGRLFDRLLRGDDPLTNMHANTTIPEVIGCARAYDITGDEKWRGICEAYWRSGVTERGWYATGGQSCGEIWSPKMALGARLGKKAQEHCTVYNMMRLAAFLFRWTKDAEYLDYIERNRINGIMAQAYWQGSFTHGAHSDHPDHALLTYFLPMNSGAVKGWASETQDFFCCHGSMIQANAQLARNILYQDGTDIYLGQYINAHARLDIGGQKVMLTQKRDTLAGSFHLSSDSTGRQNICDAAWQNPHQPDCHVQYLRLDMDAPATFRLFLRMPWWLKGEADIWLNGQPFSKGEKPGSFYSIERVWQPGDTLRVSLPMGVTADPLPDDPRMVAFLYGPTVLAGLCDGERELKVDLNDVSSVLVHDNEREWGNWMSGFRAVGQVCGLKFIPLNEVGFEQYSVYFPIAAKQS
jgi:DUF1680 family protein